jgi:hypothetical protein
VLMKNRLLMKRRREHGECETRPGGRGCLVLGTAVCETRKGKIASRNLKGRLGSICRGRERILWVLTALLGIVVATIVAHNIARPCDGVLIPALWTGSCN